MITLHKLITVAPFSEEMKRDLLRQEESLSPTKKVALEELCWALISQWYHNEIQARSEITALDMAKGESPMEKDDLSRIPEELLIELSKKLEAASSEEEIKELREKLAGINDHSTN